jgi:hypothetical protein
MLEHAIEKGKGGVYSETHAGAVRKAEATLAGRPCQLNDQSAAVTVPALRALSST